MVAATAKEQQAVADAECLMVNVCMPCIKLEIYATLVVQPKRSACWEPA